MPLFLVATPIGNLEDITLRAIEVLRQSDVIASEDTRKTGRLLKHFSISAPQMSFFEHNEQAAGQKIMRLLAEGKVVSLVTSAGTPGISDPGYTIVREAIAADMEVSMMPGPSAPLMALVLSGLPVHSFTFKGFAPRKKRRKTFFEQDKSNPHTMIFFEAPHRLERFLEETLAIYGDRSAAVCLELTKKFERIRRGKLSELLTKYQNRIPKGEIVIVIAGYSDKNQCGITAASN